MSIFFPSAGCLITRLFRCKYREGGGAPRLGYLAQKHCQASPWTWFVATTAEHRHVLYPIFFNLRLKGRVAELNLFLCLSTSCKLLPCASCCKFLIRGCLNGMQMSCSTNMLALTTYTKLWPENDVTVQARDFVNRQGFLAFSEPLLTWIQEAWNMYLCSPTHWVSTQELSMK